MANITFTIEELLNLLTCNNLLPSQIKRVQIKEDIIHFAIRTESFLLPFVPASLKYLGFENDIIKFELSIVSGHFNKALEFFGQSYESKLPNYVKLELPNVLVDLKIFFQEYNIKGIQVKEITNETGQFSIITEPS